MTTKSQRQTAPASSLRGRFAVGAILACLSAAVIGATSALANPVARDTPNLQKGLDALVAAGAPGAILVVRNGSHTISYTAGLADVKEKRPMRAIDRFRIASLTKTYTATVVLQLVGEGKLRLSDSVEHWLPGLVPNGGEITIRQLLNHTSGLFDDEKDSEILKPYYAGELGHYWSMRQLVEHAVTHKPLFTPGARWSYSNTNYILAALIVEAVTGHSFGAELQSRILRPLHLDATSYPTTPKMPNPYAHGYFVFGTQQGFDITNLSPSLYSASGAIVSNVADIADFYRGLLTAHLLRPAELAAMKIAVGPNGKATARHGYGLGLVRWPLSCGTAWGQDGGIPGYETRIYSSADGRRQAVLFINHDLDTLPKSDEKLFDGLLATAYCSLR
jgi:D-alanyl-D-alanine carboxypeptidase